MERVVLGEWGTGKRRMWTNGDSVMLVVMVEKRIRPRRKVRSWRISTRKPKRAKRFAKRRPGPTRLARNVSGSTSMTRRRFWSSWVALAAVDEWEQGRVAEIHAEGERRRHEHRQVGAAAVARMQERGETLAAIAELAGVKVSRGARGAENSGRTTGRATGCTRRAERGERRAAERARERGL